VIVVVEETSRAVRGASFTSVSPSRILWLSSFLSL